MGKLFGGGLGFALGGPFGALLGVILGHHTLDKSAFLSADERRHSIFFVATFSMLGKLSKADGVVSTEEVQLVEELMRENLKLEEHARQIAIKIFTAAKSSENTFQDYAEQFFEEFQDQPEVLASLVDLLLRLAHADGVMHQNELHMINSAVRIFGIQDLYEQLEARYSTGNNLEQCYRVLGAEADESLAEIKKKYRKLAMDFHPDRVQARGVSPELAAASETRFKEIQQAYDVVEKHLSARKGA